MAGGTIKSIVPRSDIVNNLTTNDSTKVLSAAQGYELNIKITNRVITKDITVTFNNETSVSVDAASILESGKGIDDIESIYCFERYSATPIWLAYSGGNNKFYFISNTNRNFNAYMRVVVCYKID